MLMINAASMMRYRRTFNRQMHERQIRFQDMLLKKVRRVMRKNVQIFFLNTKTISNSYCNEVENLSSNDDEDNLAINEAETFFRRQQIF
jgi:hypothetical protein